MIAVVVAGLFAMLVSNRFFGRRAIETHGESLVEQGLQRMVWQLQRITDEAIAQNDVLVSIASDQGEAANPADTVLAIAPMFISRPSLTYVGLALEENGEYAFLQRSPNGGVTMRHYAVEDDGTHAIVDHEIDATGRSVATRRSAWDGYDPRDRPFYRAVRQRGERVWTD